MFPDRARAAGLCARLGRIRCRRPGGCRPRSFLLRHSRAKRARFVLGVESQIARCRGARRTVLDAVAGCGTSPEIQKAKPLLKKRSISLEVSDQKMQNALSIWQAAPAPCTTDAVLTHILSKLPE